MLRYSPSLISASALYVSLKLLSKDDPWTANLAAAIGYGQAALKPCAKDLIILMQLVSKSSLQAVRKKFSSARYMEVGLIRIGRKN